jgi:preprotein translocase subunit SecE
MKLITYIQETRGELKHVSWPSRSQAIAFTVIVIVIALLTAVFLGLFDALFAKLLSILVNR